VSERASPSGGILGASAAARASAATRGAAGGGEGMT